MRKKTQIFLFSIGIGLFTWFLDAIFDFVFGFNEFSFLELLLFNIPLHELFHRLLLVILFISLGILINHLHNANKILKVEMCEKNLILDRVDDFVFYFENPKLDLKWANQAAKKHFNLKKKKFDHYSFICFKDIWEEEEMSKLFNNSNFFRYKTSKG